MMRSIRASLVVGTVAATLAIIALAGTAVYRGVRLALVGQLDQALETEARLLASAVKLTPEGLDLGFEDLDMGQFAVESTSGYLQLWQGRDRVLFRSPSLGQGNLVRFPGEGKGPAFEWTSLNRAPRLRVVAFGFQPALDEEDGKVPEEAKSMPDIDLVLARSASDVDGLLARLRGLLASVGLLTGLVSGGVLAAVIRRSMRPLDRLADEISRLSSGELSTRIALPAIPREVAPVVEQLNGLLSRLEAAFQRERTFSADIAHELRTPLAGLRSTIEVAVSRSRPADDYQATLNELLEIIRRLQAMTERLLYLSRLDAGQIETEESVVDLCELVQASSKPLEERAAQRRLDLQWKLNPGVCAVTDPLLLEVAIRNVLDNAVAYAREGGYLIIAVEDQGSRSVLRVANGGSTVAQEDVPGLMDRFSRADRSRGATGLHCGLGLAMVSRIAAVLGCSLDIRSSVGGEFQVVLSLPNHSTTSFRASRNAPASSR